MISERESGESSSHENALETLCSDLTTGFHAVAQPLTILRASLGSYHSDAMNMDQLRELVANSAAEVERLCTLFDCMQEIVIVHSIEPVLLATPMLPLMARIADGVTKLFEMDGMLLCSQMPDTCESVLVDRDRILAALTGVLLIAHTMARARDAVELIVSSTSASTVRVLVRNDKSHARTMNAEAKLFLVLAEASIRSQGAGFSFSPQPFRVQIELKKAPFTN
jgi:hypothetical protein